jgi:hypothetical protein
MKCIDCGTELHCINSDELCAECDGYLSKCKNDCKTPCRNVEEMARIHERIESIGLVTY